MRDICNGICLQRLHFHLFICRIVLDSKLGHRDIACNGASVTSLHQEIEGYSRMKSFLDIISCLYDLVDTCFIMDHIAFHNSSSD